MTRDEIAAIMLAAMAQHGVPTDTLEVIATGNPHHKTPPGAIYAALAALEARGMVVVPAEPTHRMIDNGGEFVARQYGDSDWEEAKDMAEGLDVAPIYRAMLAARPEQE